MGKKLKKIQWRKLSLNELPNKCDECGDENCDNDEEEEKAPTTEYPSGPPSYPRSQGPLHRRPFHPNFHPGDQRRFPHPPFDPRGNGTPFERGPSLERCPHPKFFGRPFHYDQRPPFPGARRRPFKYYGGRGGFYVQGPSPYGGDGGPHRRWSGDEGLALEDGKEDEGEEGEEGERPSQPVHTVLIDNEYTKIQTPRQEVIFKKSSLDRKRDSIDMGSAPSTCGSVTGGDPGSQGDQVSLAGSVEDTVLPGEDPPLPNGTDNPNGSYEDTNNLFVGEPGKPPLAGVVMQQAYPGGPMISIPVHWTPFLDPGLIPGDTALTPLDPAFTHVIDPEDLPVDPAHILPVQHDSNGVPVTVQVKVDAEGLPIEIEPSAFTVSLNTLEPHQQELLLHRSHDILGSGGHQGPAPAFTAGDPAVGKLLEEEEKKKKSDLPAEEEEEEEEEKDEREELPHPDSCEERRPLEKGGSGAEHKDSEDSSSDSQYASMSEASTAPTTPSGELSDPSDCSESSKTKNPKMAAKTEPDRAQDDIHVSRSDSLLDSESLEAEATENPCSYLPVEPSPSQDTQQTDVEHCHLTPESFCPDNNSSPSATEESVDVVPVSRNSSLPSTSDESLTNFSSGFAASETLAEPAVNRETDATPAESQESLVSSKRNTDTTKRKSKKSRKSRSLSLESNLSSQNSSIGDIKVSERDDDEEAPSKYQAKRLAKKAKKERKRLNKEKAKNKTNNSNNNKKLNIIDEPLEDKSSVQMTETSSQDSVFLTEDTEVIDDLEVDVSEITASESSGNPIETSCIETNCSETEKEEEVTVTTGEQTETTEQSKEDVEIPEGKTEESTLKITDQDKLNVTETTEEEKVTSPDQEQNEVLQESEVDNSNTSEHTSTGDEDQTKVGEKEPSNSTSEKAEVPSDPQNDEENYVCKPGFVMVPILTPYYDPAVLYGYPLVVPETPPERSYNKKKKKKFKKKYQEEMYLDSELYAGEPFVATPNGYIVPVEPSQLCHVHGYQYVPSMYPPMLPDEGFVSVEHSPYIQDYVREPMYHNVNHFEEMERHDAGRFSRLHNVERKQIEEVLQERLPQGDAAPRKDCHESCDSGVSESEETSQSKENQGEGVQGSKDESKDNKKSNDKEETKEEREKQGNDEKDERGKTKKDSKKKNKNKKKEKPKKQIMEILEPDFSSFSSSVLIFQTKEEQEELKRKQNKKPKVKKKKNTKEQTQTEVQIPTESESPLPEVVTEPNILVPVGETQTIPSDSKATNSGDSSPTKSKKNRSKSGVESPIASSIAEVKEETVNETEENPDQEVVVTSKKARRKRSKTSKQSKEKSGETAVKEEASKEGMETPLFDTPECLTSDHFVDQLHEDSLSQTSENVAFSENCLSQESEYTVTSDIGFNQEQDNYSISSEFLSQESGKDVISEDTSNEDLSTSPSSCLPLLSNASESLLIDESHTLPEKDELHEAASEQTPTCAVPAISNDPPATSDDLADESSSSCSPLSHGEPSTLSLQDEESNSSTPTLTEQSSVLPEDVDDSGQSFKDLGVTEAVRRWIREVTPEKAFTLSNETRTRLLSSVISSDEEDVDDISEDDEKTNDNFLSEQQSKNVQGNPSVASPSECSLDEGSERVAPLLIPCVMTSQRDTPPPGGVVLQTAASQDMLDEYDGESVISNLSRGRLYSSSSSCSFPLAPHLEDATPLTDPRVYDPSVYSKYYQLGVDVQATPSNTSTRESTLSPTLVESGSEEIDLFPQDRSRDPTDLHAMSLATELFKSEKIRTNMTHISPSLCKPPLPLPHCGCPTPSLGEHQLWDETESYNPTSHASERAEISQRHDHLCSVSSSGIGSSLASTPNASPAHSSSTSSGNTNTKSKLEPHPLKNLSVGEGSLPCRAVCCSVM